MGIRTSARQRGLATQSLRLMLSEAQRLGVNSVLIVCAADNLASAKTIERAGRVQAVGSGCSAWVRRPSLLS
ncbi:MAG: GNAT family N-acetyltransferase [Nocardiaceae bacterium]|nr:GNAT family N-acetyltransferase [Nocardiaceae bacterium]